MNIKKWVPYILSILFIVFVFLMLFIQMNNLNTMIEQQETEISDLQGDITEKESMNKSTHESVVAQSTGLDANHVQRDNRIASELLDKCLTWSSYAEYTRIRESLIKDYNLKEDSNFLSVFMPEIVNRELNGKNYNRIDVFNYNLSYEGMTPYVTDISEDGGTYSYFTFVTISSKDDSGYEGNAKSAFIYTIDKDGNITNLDASIITG